MDINAVLWIINILSGVIMFFLQSTVRDLKEQSKETRQELEKVKETHLRRDDFNEFKSDLWARLDKMENGLQKALDK